MEIFQKIKLSENIEHKIKNDNILNVFDNKKEEKDENFKNTSDFLFSFNNSITKQKKS